MNRKNACGSVLLIVMAILVMLMMSSVIFAQEPESNSDRKKTTFFISTIAAIIPPAQESSAANFNVEVNEERNKGDNGYRYLMGWVYINDMETKGQKVYVQFEKPDGTIVHYSTVLIERPDLGTKNPLYSHSGFCALIPLKDKLDVEACTTRFIVENKNGIYKSPVFKAGIRFSSHAKLVLPEMEYRGVNYGMDWNEERKKGSCNYHFLSGWIYVNDQETKGQEVYVQFERPNGTIVHYTTMPVMGSGIKNKNLLYANSGFCASIPLKDELNIDAYTIRFVLKNKNGIYISPIWHAGIRFSSRVEIVLREPESQAVNLHIDVNEARKSGTYDFHYLSGWIYINDQETRGQEIYVQLEKPDGTVVNYSTIQIERPDVGAGFKNQLYNASGFSASIPLKDGLDIDACTIRLVVKNKNGIYKSPEWKSWSKVSSSSGKLTIFVIVNWLLVIVTALVLLVNIWRDRSLLIKPSIMAILFFHVMCQWGTAIQASQIELFLPKPWIFVLLSHGFPIIGLAVSLLIWRRDARRLWKRITLDESVDPAGKTWAWAILAVCFIGFIAVYLSHVPFRSTGLYKIFFSPTESGLARDMSVKFLDNTFLRYGHNIMMAVFAPLLAVLAVQLLFVHKQRRNWLWVLFFLLSLGAILLAVSISGARGYSASLLLVVVFALLLRKGFPINPLYLAVGVLLVIFFPTMLTLLREGKAVTTKNILEYFRGSTYQRVVIIPMETGLYHVQYTQQHGYFGIQAIPRLAAIKGIEPLIVPNFIGKLMSGSPLDTTTANTAFVYAYYSYFGLIAFIPCLIGLWLLDLCLLVYRRLSDAMLVPCVASVAIGVNIFSSVEYTVGLITFGILILPLVSWAVDLTVCKIELKKKVHWLSFWNKHASRKDKR